MKLNYINIAFLLIGIATQAQLFVSPNSYVFADNQILFVTQDVELNAATSNLYLRNGSQLMQGTAGAGSNKGLGDLSVYQEGTVNNYLYNYWCSPVGNTLTATVVNNPFGISQLKEVTGLTTASNPILLPFGSYDGLASPLSIATRWIYTFTTSNTYAQWNYIGGANTIPAGSGFTMKGTTAGNQRYDFRGKPNDGNITSAVSIGNFTLVGNPYPSAIDLNLFILDPANAALIDGRILFWEQVNVASHFIAAYQGGYGTYTTAGYTAAPFFNNDSSGNQTVPTGGTGIAFTGRRFSPIGQGFMVKGKANGTVTMKNTFRLFQKEDATSQFAKGNFDKDGNEYYPEVLNIAGIDYTQIKKGYAPQLKINAMFNNGGVRPTTLAFRDDFTDGADYSADAKMSSSQTADFYYVVENEEYLANALKFDIDKRIAIGLKCTSETNFKIKVVDILYGFDANQDVYIYDKETGVYTDIKNGMFEMTLPTGNNRSRFEITFKQGTLSTNNNIANNFSIFQNDVSGNLIIKNPNNIDLKSFNVYDIAGKSILVKNELGTNAQFEFSSTSLSKGIYVVKLLTVSNQEITKKVAVNNKK
ncbi:T9SS type A sorting domain-containing protein [Flavobacterium sp.]|uniref:T9SS type A sorting domain-containing protein n=1 Tax=Flavobacterium sp. TaxID=239 RepID=UPI00286B1918|nr:T9SS type A sorting domain-containing protein [Flavobacterium sp.]